MSFTTDDRTAVDSTLGADVEHHDRDDQPPVRPDFGPYPTLRRRVGAWLIDAAISSSLLCCGLLAWMLAFMPSRAQNALPGSTQITNPFLVLFLMGAGLLLVALGLFYMAFEEAREAGQTLGKRFFKLRVVRYSDGRPLGTNVARDRYIARLTDLTGIGLLWATFDPCRRTWHDHIAGTIVIDSRRFGSATECLPSRQTQATSFRISRRNRRRTRTHHDDQQGGR